MMLARLVRHPAGRTAHSHSMLAGLAFLLALNAGPAPAAADPGMPRYGGTLTVASELSTVSIAAWDPGDWHWKVNHDALYLDHLFVGDLGKSTAGGAAFDLGSGAWLPDGALKGELAESWEVIEVPLSIVVRLRKGIMWPARPGIMASRELVAGDVLFSFQRLRESPRATRGYYDYIERVEARDPHTVVFHLKALNSEWARRFGYGLYCGILPSEVGGLGRLTWENAVGTGPFSIESYREGSAYIYARNPLYWGSASFGGEAHKLPFIDRLVYPVAKDPAIVQAGFRTGKIDILRNIPWQAVEALKKTSPQLLWNRHLDSSGTFIALRMDAPPFDKLAVRKAVNLAVNRREIIEKYYGGDAELFNYPMSSNWRGYYQPLEAMPPGVSELFTHSPERARQLLREAGYPHGFAFDVQVSGSNSEHLNLLTLVAGYLEKVGVRLNIKPMEYGSFVGVLKNGRHAAGYMITRSHLTPVSTLARQFSSKIFWNASRYNDPKLDQQIRAAEYSRDESYRIRTVRAMTEDVLAQAPFILLPTHYEYQAWWPWVKNYDGEWYAGPVRPGPIYAQVWIDQEMKKAMGF